MISQGAQTQTATEVTGSLVLEKSHELGNRISLLVRELENGFLAASGFIRQKECQERKEESQVSGFFWYSRNPNFRLGYA